MKSELPTLSSKTKKNALKWNEKLKCQNIT